MARNGPVGQSEQVTYTGDVHPGGPSDVRELDTLTITKISVGPMDNNAYLLRSPATGDAVLIDAANEQERLWQARCRPTVQQDMFGINRYAYAAPGCEYGKNK